MKRTILSTFLFLSIPLLLYGQVKGVTHVILIGVDGMGANYLAKAKNIPIMKMMMREGAYSLHARCVLPSSSADNWAAMTMGAGPSLTGYTEWNSETPEIPPRVTGRYGMFPDIFSIMRQQMPQSQLGVIYSWKGISYLFPKQAVNENDYTKYDSVTVQTAVDYIKEKTPNFLFIHLSAVDAAGHSKGWGSPAYYHAIQETDKRIGKIIQAVKEAGIMNHTVIIVSADHGGIHKGHGGKTLKEMEIPWIIYGRGVKKGKKLTLSIMTYDTAATIAWIFGLKQPQVWIGRSVKAAFKK